jgi:hypothetical protein
MEARFERLGHRNLDVNVEVRMKPGDPASYWSIAVNNRAGLAITDVQFPFLLVSYKLAGTPSSEALLIPFWMGRLLNSPKPQQLQPDSPRAWQFRPETNAFFHYPGLTMAQFLAFYNDRAGILLSCRDTSGRIKLIKAVHHQPGIRLGMTHVGDWPADGTRQLEYEIAVQAFHGDWYTAAEIYRDWSLQQPWAQAPLHKRNDVPEWLLEYPPHIMIRLQGELDEGPTSPNSEFLPYTKLTPLLDRISARVESPLVPVLMAWEKGGPWVYPDCFPPVGGEESLADFARQARERKWHVGSYSNGTRWVTEQLWSGYQGEEYFETHGGEKSVCRTAEGQLWREQWDLRWRSSYTCCVAVSQTHEIALNYVERLVACGLDWIQFLDQNVGCATFPCYASDHGHPRMPGRWMSAGMQRLLSECNAIARRIDSESGGARPIIFSVESPPNEYFMPFFSVCDNRVSPPGFHVMADYVPLYHFLYHEFLLMQGGFGFGPEPYHLVTQTAYNFVLGQICGGVLTGDGTLLNKDTINWAPWQPHVGNNEDPLEMLRCATALRRGKGRSYLALGRMQRPSRVTGIPTVKWTYEERDNAIPAVFHAAWRDPRGNFAVALANWTGEEHKVVIEDRRLGPRATASVAARAMAKSSIESPFAVTLPPHSCALIESA